MAQRTSELWSKVITNLFEPLTDEEPRPFLLKAWQERQEVLKHWQMQENASAFNLPLKADGLPDKLKYKQAKIKLDRLRKQM